MVRLVSKGARLKDNLPDEKLFVTLGLLLSKTQKSEDLSDKQVEAKQLQAVLSDRLTLLQTLKIKLVVFPTVFEISFETS